MSASAKSRSVIRGKLECIVLLVAFLANLLSWSATAQETARPNFVLILADDLGWNSLSQPMDERVPNSRSDFHETPNLERLAKAGMRFTSGYASAALCCPTRRSIQFGQTPTRQGNERFARDYDPAQRPRLTIPRLLKSVDARYRTAHYGKWDLRAEIFPEDLGYDESDGNTGNRHGNVSSDQQTKFTTYYLNEDPKKIETLTSRALNFIRRNHASGNPFFLQLSHYATHVDIQTRPETYTKYAAKKPGQIHSHPAWAAMQEDLDAGIGRVLDLIEELGLAKNTYVIFMADNGGVEFIPPVKNKMDHPSTFPTPPRNHPLRGGKWVLYEGGIRVPFFVQGPGITAGSQCDVPVAGWDILPTVASLAGYAAPLPADLDGGSFRSLLETDTGVVKRPVEGLVFHRYTTAYPHSAIRVGDFKLIKTWKTQKLELYNLKEDLGETTDLAARLPDKGRELHVRLMDYRKQVDAEVLRGYGNSDDEQAGTPAGKDKPIIQQAAAGTASTVPPNILTESEIAAGWRLLWDGKTTTGWRDVKSETFPSRKWQIADGVLTVLSANDPMSVGRGSIITRERFTNFALVADFKLTPGANSGIKYFVQSNLDPENQTGAGPSVGCEFQILDDERHPDARQGRDGNRTLGSLYDLIPAAVTKQPKPIGEWNTARILVRGKHVEHWLNGQKVLEYERGSAAFRAGVAQSKFNHIPAFGEWPTGHILLQEHGDQVHFRNIKIRALPAE
ncbi:MAG: sulfatase-like hydrolase/transferase [Verrucomicrobia bacterium]|nr:sulfatase-like hydrolase/transferase [Verrucomicrobiota bacterium]